MQAFLYGSGITVLYIIIAATVMLTVRKLTKIPDELFRKMLHFILLGAYIPLTFAFDAWWQAALFALSLLAVLFPILSLAERLPMFSRFVNERKKGEFKGSMVLAVGMMAFSVSLCRGLFEDKYIVLASIYAWGVGDALAALVGKRFGKHRIKWRFADGKKTVEGSASMLVCSFISVLTVLLIRGGITLPICICIAVLTSAVCTVAEMCTKGGFDTVVCPLAAMAVIIPTVMMFGGV